MEPEIAQVGVLPLLPSRKSDRSRAPVPGTRWADGCWRDWVSGEWELTEEEGMRLERQGGRARWCGAGWARMSSRAGDGTERSQVLMCGQRGCPGCGVYARDRARRRIATSDIYHAGIEWRCFVTLTIPRQARQCKEDAWKDAGGRVSAWTSKLQKLYEARGVPENERHIAWVLERHKDGWPHVHAVLSLRYPENRYNTIRLVRLLRSRWNAAWGINWSIVQLEKPRHRHRAGDYLSKYVAKMEDWGRELLALMYRKRMWASTLPLVPSLQPAPPRWQVEAFEGMTRAIRRYQRAMGRGDILQVDGSGFVMVVRAQPLGQDAGCYRWDVEEWMDQEMSRELASVPVDRWVMDRHRQLAMGDVAIGVQLEMRTWVRSEEVH